MGLNKTSVIICLSLIGLSVVAYMIYSAYFVKIDFDTESINGKPLTDIVREYKSFTKNLNDKSAKALFFGLYLIRKLEDETLLNIDKMDTAIITRANEIFEILDEKNVIDGNFCKYLSIYKRHFEFFDFEEKDGKNYLDISNEEIKLIEKNESVIDEIGKISTDYFTEDCANYLKTKNFYSLKSDSTAYSAIEIILVRYELFATDKSLDEDIKNF